MRVSRFLVGVAHTLWWLILPPRLRRESRLSLDHHHLPRWSLGFGFACLFAGSLVYGLGLHRFMHRFSSQAADVLLAKGSDVTTRDAIAYNLSGSIGFVSFSLTPTAWLGYYLMAGEGLGRFIGYWIGGEAIGSPIVTLGVWVASLLNARGRRERRRLELGREEPDRIAGDPAGPEGSLVVLSNRDKDWRPEATVQIGERFYRFTGVEERRAGGRLRLTYRLEPWPEHVVIRGLIVYNPPENPVAQPRT